MEDAAQPSAGANKRAADERSPQKAAAPSPAAAAGEGSKRRAARSLSDLLCRRERLGLRVGPGCHGPATPTPSRRRRAAVTALSRGAGAATVAGSRTGQSQTLVQLA